MACKCACESQGCGTVSRRIHYPIPPDRPKPLKKMLVFPNDDPHNPGYKFTLTSDLRSWDSVLNTWTRKLRPKFGHVTRVFTPVNGTDVTDVEQLKDNGVYIVSGGPESSRKNPRFPNACDVDSQAVNEMFRSDCLRKRTCPLPQAPLVKRSEAWTPIDKRKRILQVLPIHVFLNGDVVKPAVRVVLRKYDLYNMDRMLDAVRETLKPPAGTIKELFTLSGRQILHVRDLEPNNFYVAIAPLEKFTPGLKYNMYGSVPKPVCMDGKHRYRKRTSIADSRTLPISRFLHMTCSQIEHPYNRRALPENCKEPAVLCDDFDVPHGNQIHRTCHPDIGCGAAAGPEHFQKLPLLPQPQPGFQLSPRPAPVPAKKSMQTLDRSKHHLISNPPHYSYASNHRTIPDLAIATGASNPAASNARAAAPLPQPAGHAPVPVEHNEPWENEYGHLVTDFHRFLKAYAGTTGSTQNPVDREKWVKSYVPYESDAEDDEQKKGKRSQSQKREHKTKQSFGSQVNLHPLPLTQTTASQTVVVPPQPIVIRVFLNGDDHLSPIPIQLEVEDLANLNSVKAVISERINGLVFRLHTIDGSVVESIGELKNEGHYVVTLSNEDFKKAKYIVNPSTDPEVTGSVGLRLIKGHDGLPDRYRTCDPSVDPVPDEEPCVLPADSLLDMWNGEAGK